MCLTLCTQKSIGINTIIDILLLVSYQLATLSYSEIQKQNIYCRGRINTVFSARQRSGANIDSSSLTVRDNH